MSTKMAEQLVDDNKFTGVRLPTQVKPVHYDLTLTPDLKLFTFEGSVEIYFESSTNPSPANEIVLHASELVISQGHIKKGDSEDVFCSLAKVIYSKKTETATLVFDGPIPDAGKLLLQFTGELNDRMKGFYRTEVKIDDFTVYSATTQFESTDARSCFPCWDEPAIKATFSVTMICEKLLKFQGKTKSHEYPIVVISNTPSIEEKLHPDLLRQVVKFDKTPIMSTYLLAFIVGPFEYIESSDGKRPIRVYTTPGKKELGRYALEVACKSLPYYEEYFNIEYPLAKMDLVAIPDFSSGAMENWGLVTYRETCLLVDPNNTSTNTKQYVAIVVAHELAHQWFGNLVTMEWWTHLWLNEGFASFMEYLCTDHIFPEYSIWPQFVTDAYSSAMSLDSLRTSHPIEVPVKNSAEINEIFDAISYSKGASVIRMLYNYIGDDSFRKGMHDYLTKFAYKNAFTEDLWESLEKASNKPVCELMSGWTSQRGYPWLSVTQQGDGGDSVKLSITQNRFVADGKFSAEDNATSWLIPIEAVTSSNPTKPMSLGLIRGKESVITVNDVNNGWLKLNPGSIGLYRTAYPEEMMMKLLPAIKDQTLSAPDRLGIQNDYYALCQAGIVKTTELLTLLGAYTEDTDYIVWRSIDSCCSGIDLLLANTDFRDSFRSFGRKLYANIYKKVGWTPKANESYDTVMTRPLVVGRLVSFGDESVIEEAKRRFKAHVAKVEIIPADLRAAVYKAIVSYGDDEMYECLFDIYRDSELHEEKQRVSRTLGFAKSQARIQRVIDFALSDQVRNQDKPIVIAPLGLAHPQVAWKFVQDHKDMLREKYSSGHLLSTLVKYSTENFATEEMAQEISEFFKVNPFPLVERTVKQSLETIRLKADWLSRDGKAIEAFLSG